jgi:hypothetical protein
LVVPLMPSPLNSSSQDLPNGGVGGIRRKK